MADTKIIVDCSTGEVQELPLSPEELAQREAAEAAAAEAKASAQAKLTALGLTADEIAALSK